ncbi:MAG: hypothetical protein M3083_22145 [Actinomycetota bacterium]|nr:hypothetical protein [Actinomycetota bacterium]
METNSAKSQVPAHRTTSADLNSRHAPPAPRIRSVLPLVSIFPFDSELYPTAEGSGRGLAGVTVGVILLGVDFGLLAMLVGSKTGSRGTALGVSSGVAAASYLLSSLAPAVAWLHPLRYLSVFYYSVGDNQLTYGMGLAQLAVLTVAGILLIIATQRAFEHLDVP